MAYFTIDNVTSVFTAAIYALITIILAAMGIIATCRRTYAADGRARLTGWASAQARPGKCLLRRN